MTAVLKPTQAPPAPDAWVIDPQLVAPERRALIPRYADATWVLRALIDNPSATIDYIYWERFPDTLREAFRHAAWALINYPLAPGDVRLYGAPMREKLSPGRMYKTVHQWAIFARWLEKRGVSALSAVTVEDLVDYSVYLAKERNLARNTVASHLICLSRLHHYGAAHLPARDRLVAPPWTNAGMDEYLPAASTLGENVTEPISAETMGPLLVWALRFVELFAEDILAAVAVRERLIQAANADKAREDGGIERLTAYLERLREAGQPIPVRTRYATLTAATTYIAGMVNTHHSRVTYVLSQPTWREYMREHHGPALLGSPINARLDGLPWHGPIEFEQVNELRRHLTTACFIVIAYLTGMRPGEVLALEHGCCPEPEGRDQGPARHVIYGRQFKNAKDEDGNHLSAGVVREAPWIAVPQVVTAVRVLERMVSEGMLFGAAAHDPRLPHLRANRSLAQATTANRISDFIRYVNDYTAKNGREGESIPDDPGGFIGVGRFRRTLAWHIARRPGGLVALAVQYGHMRTVISESYASRSRDGVHTLLDFETARVVAERLSEVHEALDAGDGVSGPAARRLINAATQEHHQFGGMITTKRQAAKLLADPALNVFENKEAYLMCNYDRSKALCDPGRGAKAAAPSLDRCRSNCANIARTDAQAEAMRAHAQRLRAQADSPVTPAPLADRMREKALQLDAASERHNRERITLEEEKGA